MIRDAVASANARRGFLCLGLDPPPELSLEDAEALLTKVIDAAAEPAAAAKANIAMFLVHGGEGLELLRSILKSARQRGLLTILDAKWADVDHTMEAYARALDRLGAELVTLNPSLGIDPLKPLLNRAFLVCRTTNAGATVVQDHGEPPLARVVAEAAERLGCGLVLPGNDAKRLKEALGWAPTAPVLLPGLGAQGGSAATLPDLRGRPALVNVGRAILRASDPAAEARRWADGLSHPRSTPA